MGAERSQNMTIHLPEELQRYVHEQILAGRFMSEDDVIMDALERQRQAQQPAVAPDKGREELSSQELQRRLLEAGIISEIKPPITDLTPYLNRRAIPIMGEPLSETVIRERR
jgi:Arc/MetJ-type ribon-helix-helix transcriptional regulator